MTRVFQITSETVISQSRRDYRFIAFTANPMYESEGAEGDVML